MSEIIDIKVSYPQDEILRSIKELNLFLAGYGSGKTYTGGLIAAEYIINFPKAIGLIGANTYQQLTKSTLKNIFETWHKQFGWVNGIEYVVDRIPPKNFTRFEQPLKSYENTICFSTGAVLFTASLDNYKAIDGTEIAYAILDETKDTKEEAVKDVIIWRLRQKAMYIGPDGVLYDYAKEGTEGFCPLYIFTSPAKVDWINNWFELSDKYEEISKKIFSKTEYFSFETKSKKIVISSTWHNEDNLPAGYIQKKIEDFAGNQDKIDMFVYGSPIAKSGGEWLHQFRRLKHVSKVPFLPGHNIHISLDFNYVPYITMLLFQIVKQEDIYYIRFFKEMCLSSPKNNTEDLCKQLENDFLLVNNPDRELGLFYYGDASGKSGSTRGKENDFQILERVLRKWISDKSNRVMRKNPSLNKSRMFLNKLFADGFPIRVLIDESMKNFIDDLEFVKEDPDGGILVEKVHDKIIGSYEKRGHCIAAGRYGIVSAFNNVYNNYLNK